jgi:hypothetical protein
MANPGLRLLAEDEEDLKILSAHVQDAVVRIGDVAYLPKARRFAMLLNRYRWEDDADAKNAGLRMLAGLHFENVLGAKALNLTQDDPDALVELLAVGFTPGAQGAGTVELCLAGGGSIRLQVECIDASLRDMAGPWPAKARPEHKLEQG